MVQPTECFDFIMKFFLEIWLFVSLFQEDLNNDRSRVHLLVVRKVDNAYATPSEFAFNRITPIQLNNGFSNHRGVRIFPFLTHCQASCLITSPNIG